MKIKRAILFRVGAIALLVVIAALMMLVGRGHTVYFDNKSIEYDGRSYDTPYKVVINVDGEQVAKLYDKERGMTTCIGQNLKMTLEITQEKGGDEVTTDYNLKLPYNIDGIVINLPAFLAGLPEEAYISVFVPAVTEQPAEETPMVDEFAILEGETEPAA